MAFRLTSLFYLTALLASALAAFGVWGLVIAGMVGVGGCCLRLLRGRGGVVLFSFTIAMTLVLVGATVFLFLRGLSEALDKFYGDFMKSDHQLSELAVGLQDLQQPSASPPHSWRAYLLAKNSTWTQFVASNYRFAEPWDSPHNRADVTSQLAPLYQRPLHVGGERAHYLTIVDPRCAYHAGGILPPEEISDGAEKTLLLIQTTSFDIAWNEPRDLTFDEALTLLTTEPTPESRDWHILESGFFYRDQKFRKGATADGPAIDLRIPLERETAVALLTANGGEYVDWDKVSPWSDLQLDYAKIGSLAVFAVLAILPIVVAMWRRIAPHWFSVQQQSHPDDSGVE